MGFPPTTLDYHGVKGLALEDPGEMSVAIDGIATCTAVFRIPVADWSKLPGAGLKHPVFTTLQGVRFKISIKGVYAYSSVEYEGVSPIKMGDMAEGIYTPTYELVRGLSEDPIDTHPWFDKIAGTATDPKNGAIFYNAGLGNAGWAWSGTPASEDKGYLFHGFSVTGEDGKPNPFAKMEVYLNPSKMTWRKSWIAHSRPAGSNAGKITSNPEGPAPALKSPQNWMNMGNTSTQRGSVFQCTEEWMASGPRGWNDTVYSW